MTAVVGHGHLSMVPDQTLMRATRHLYAPISHVPRDKYPAREFEVASRRSLELAKDATWKGKRLLPLVA